MTAPRVLLVVGSGYSGSTLLDMIMGTHSRARSFGELRNLDEFLDRDARCTCDRRASECTFWRRVLDALGPERFRLYPPNPEVLVVLGRTLRLLRTLAELTGAAVLVDSSKWIERAMLLHESGEVDARVVHLVRDGRGVVWSHMRRDEPLDEAAEAWRSRNLRTLDWLARSDAPPSLLLRYEDLARDPAAAIRRVCELVELDYRPEMLRFRSPEHHLVSGNPMRFGAETAIAVDETWRAKLGAEELARFERIAGELSRRLGYEA